MSSPRNKLKLFREMFSPGFVLLFGAVLASAAYLLNIQHIAETTPLAGISSADYALQLFIDDPVAYIAAVVFFGGWLVIMYQTSRR